MLAASVGCVINFSNYFWNIVNKFEVRFSGNQVLGILLDAFYIRIDARALVAVALNFELV